MTSLDIAHQRLVNQHIALPTLNRVEDVVAELGAVQAQDYAGAKWALGLRTQSTREHDIEKAFTDGAILRTHVLRPTWHFVTPADIRWMLALTARRVHAANAYMYRKLELNNAVFKRSNAALAAALNGGNHLTRDELRDEVQKAGIATDGEFRMGYILMQAELDGVVCSGGRRGKQFTYALLDDRAPLAKMLDRNDALVELARRYFMSRGPATVQDFAKWSGLTLADARTGLEAISAHLQHEAVGERTYWFPASKRSTTDGTATAYLMSIYDEYISSYKDRSDIIDEENSLKLQAMGNALTSITVVDGRLVGTWKRTLQKAAVVIETNTLSRLTKAQDRAVALAARRYGVFLGLPVKLT